MCESAVSRDASSFGRGGRGGEAAEVEVHLVVFAEVVEEREVFDGDGVAVALEEHRGVARKQIREVRAASGETDAAARARDARRDAEVVDAGESVEEPLGVGYLARGGGAGRLERAPHD